MHWDPGPSHPGEEASHHDPNTPGEGNRVETTCCHLQESQLLDLLDKASLSTKKNNNNKRNISGEK